MPPTLLVVDPDDAVAATRDHPLVAHLTAYPTAELPIWRYGDAVAVGYHYWDHPTIAAHGSPPDVATLVRAIGESVRSWISVPADVVPLLPTGFLLDMHDWEFRWTARPTGTRPDAAAWLGPDDEDDVRELLAAGFPDASVGPGSPRARRWAGIRDGDGRLVGCAADATGRDGTGFVASITTRPDLRGGGIGRTITGWLTDRLVAEHGRAALWVFTGNDPARAVYDRLSMHELTLTAGALPAAHDLVGGSGDESAAAVPAD
ncbi:MAG: GNAT family N-acetyltransferase [Frankiaceae bacterium]